MLLLRYVRRKSTCRIYEFMERAIRKVYENMNEAIRDKITQRRHQILVHSCIYYQYNTNIIDDHTYDRWVMELGRLHAEYPAEAKAADMAKEFEGFTTEIVSGFDLPYHDPRTVSTAAWLIDYHKK